MRNITLYEWGDDWEIGNPDIDAQHKRLVESLNELMTACQHGAHRVQLENMLDFLVSYTAQHFADEEAFQLKCAYPDYPQHKKLHDEFTAVAVALKEQMERDGPSIGLIAEIYTAVGAWLAQHIKGEDMKVGRHSRGEA
jgi:hemerythrin